MAVAVVPPDCLPKCEPAAGAKTPKSGVNLKNLKANGFHFWRGNVYQHAVFWELYCVVVPDQKRPQLRAQSGKKEISEITGQFLASVEMDSLLLCPSNAGIHPAFLSKAS